MGNRLRAGRPSTLGSIAGKRFFFPERPNRLWGPAPFETECSVLGREADHSPRSSVRLRMRGTGPPFLQVFSWRVSGLSSETTLPVFLWIPVGFRQSVVGEGSRERISVAIFTVQWC
jgi:hypothetical protein